WPLTRFSGESLRRGAMDGNGPASRMGSAGTSCSARIVVRLVTVIGPGAIRPPSSRRRSNVATGWSLDSRMTPEATREVMSTHSPARYTRTRTRKRRGEVTTYGPSHDSHGQPCQVWTLCSDIMSFQVGL